jgi:chromosome segregation ATPase
MSNKALVYAEVTLGVHEVWENVQSELADLDTLLTELDKAQDLRRELDEKYADREVELTSEMRGIHVSYSDTRFKSEWKTWERTDKVLTELRGELNKIHSIIQGLEYERSLITLKIKAGSSRLEELGGYLHYLAAVKNQAENATKLQETA